MRQSSSWALAFVVAALAACGGADSQPAGGAPSAAASPAGMAATGAAKTYDIKGRIEAIGSGRGAVTLDHEEVKGLMPAMKMEYKVADPTVLDGLAVGDQVQGQFELRGTSEYVVLRLRK